MSQKTLESNVEARLVKYAKSKGILTYKFSSPSNRGVPDRVFIYRGAILFLELKRPGCKPTKLQLHHLKQIRDQSVPATWCDNYDTGVKLLDALRASYHVVLMLQDNETYLQTLRTATPGN